MAGAAEGPGRAGVTVLRLWAASSQTPHLAVSPVHHLDELSHPGGSEQRSKVRRCVGGQQVSPATSYFSMKSRSGFLSSRLG